MQSYSKPDAIIPISHVKKLYSKPKRAYHNWSHIQACLNELADFIKWSKTYNVRFSASRIYAALLFHDIIYDSKRKDNEELSAKLAVRSLRKFYSKKDCLSVGKLILTTKHVKPPNCLEGKLIVDIDLSILGQSRAKFDAYEKAIRKEYAWVPDAAFREGRAKVLQHFLKRKRIYSTPYFFKKYEKRARANLKRSLARLSK